MLRRARVWRTATLAAVLWVGFCGAPAGASGWFWKPAWPASPSGMPDFDQNQNFDGNNTNVGNPLRAEIVAPGQPNDGWELNYCTPTAVANSIWWYGSIPGSTPYRGKPTKLRYPELADVDMDGTIDRTGATSKDAPKDLVQALAHLMDTNDQRVPDDQHNGTWIPQDAWNNYMGGHEGTQEYIFQHFAGAGKLITPLKTRTYFYPSFEHMQSEVLSCHDVVLHVLAVGQQPPPEPEQEWADAGQTTLHSVTVAGVDCGVGPQHLGARIAISDVADDAREAVPPTCPHGRVLPAGHNNGSHGGVPFNNINYDHALHNNPLNVSHDGYDVLIPAPARAAAGFGPPPGFGLAAYLGQDVVYATVTSPTANRPISFSVDQGAEGINYTPAGQPLYPGPNDVWTLGTAGVPGVTVHGLQTEAEIFESDPRKFPSAIPPLFIGPNVDVVPAALGLPSGPHAPPPAPPPAPPGVFGLNAGDNIDALSYGRDAGKVVYFSVDPNATGVLGTGVNNEAVQATSMSGPWMLGTPANPGGGDWPVGGNEAAGDLFKADGPPGGAQFGAYVRMHWADGAVDKCWVCNHAARPLNVCFVDEQQLGLQAPANNGSFLNDGVEDDLDAVEYASSSSRIWGLDPDGDNIQDTNYFAFFSLDAPIAGTNVSPDDILFTSGATPFAFGIYANGNLLGLQTGDDLDALALSDVGGLSPWGTTPWPDGVVQPGADEALFSLAAGSPTLLALGFEPGDLFYTDFTGGFSLWLSHAQLGLLRGDELNALDVKPPCVIPEPAGLGLIGLVALGLRRRRR